MFRSIPLDKIASSTIQLALIQRVFVFRGGMFFRPVPKPFFRCSDVPAYSKLHKATLALLAGRYFPLIYGGGTTTLLQTHTHNEKGRLFHQLCVGISIIVCSLQKTKKGVENISNAQPNKNTQQTVASKPYGFPRTKAQYP